VTDDTTVAEMLKSLKLIYGAQPALGSAREMSKSSSMSTSTGMAPLSNRDGKQPTLEKARSTST